MRDTPEPVIELLAITCGPLVMFDRLQNEMLRKLEDHPLLLERATLLQSIRGVGQVTALSWALEIAEPGRFGAIGRVVSYCGLCSAQRASAGKTQRGPLSKQRNKHLQRVLIEGAKLAPRWNPQLRDRWIPFISSARKEDEFWRGMSLIERGPIAPS